MPSLANYFELNLEHTAYHSSLEHLEDYLILIKLYLQLNANLTTTCVAETVSTALIPEAWLYIASRENASDESIFLPLLAIKNALNLSFFEYFCLLLAISTELEESLCKHYTALCGNAYPSFHLARYLYNLADDAEETIFQSAALNHSPLQYLFYTMTEDTISPSLMRTSMCLRKNVMLYLTNSLTLQSDYITPFFYTQMPSIAPLHVTTFEKLIAYLNQSLSPNSAHIRQAIAIEGAKGIGKKTLIKKVCHHLHIDCLFVDLEKLIPLKEEQQQEALYDLCFKLIINNSLLCLEHYECSSNKILYEQLLKYLAPFSKLVFLCLDTPLSKAFLVPGYQFLHLQLTPPTLKEKNLYWDFMAQQYHLSIDTKVCASKYHLTIGQLDSILKDCQLIAQYEDSTYITEKHLTQGILATNQVAGNATLIKHAYTFDDLVVDQQTYKVLHQISNYVKYRYTVFEEWGYDEKQAYGKGLSMLFYGSPGTGKTMCASVLANEWNLDLLKVDLSQVIDKYIGETEKRLDQIFQTAQQNNCVLFFDEADALFSKRTEINSSNDKYANIEVSYLLQKMEYYSGIIILATNLAQNFDEAFKRRINFMVRFNLPTADIRKTLWKKAFPSKAPISETIDFELLGEKYEFSPSIIKSVALYAAFLASAEERKITMGDIMESIKYEYEKHNRMMPI